MSSDQGQSSADSTPRIVTNITEPRLDGNRVAPHDAGADMGRPSRSGASWDDSGSDDEEEYENQRRQRVQAETNMTEGKVGYQERRERCRLSAAKEEMSRQVVPEVGSLNGEQAPVPGQSRPSMSLDGPELGNYRRLTTQCSAEGHMKDDESPRHLRSRWSAEVWPAFRDNGYQTVGDQLRRSRIYDFDKRATPNAAFNEDKPTILSQGDEETSNRARFPETLLETGGLERCIEKDWTRDIRRSVHHIPDEIKDWRFPGVVGRAAEGQPSKLERSHTEQELQLPLVTRRWGYEWCGPSSPIPDPICTRGTEWKICGRDRQDLSKCGDEGTSRSHAEVFSPRLPTEVKSIKSASCPIVQGLLFQSWSNTEPVGRMKSSHVMAWSVDGGGGSYEGDRRPLPIKVNPRGRSKVTCSVQKVPSPPAYRGASQPARTCGLPRSERMEPLVEPLFVRPSATKETYERGGNRPEDFPSTRRPIERAELRCVQSDPVAYVQHRRDRRDEVTPKDEENSLSQFPGKERPVTGPMQRQLRSGQTERDHGHRTRVWIDEDQYDGLEEGSNRDVRPGAWDPCFRHPETVPRLLPERGF